jgi:hypothetical protein
MLGCRTAAISHSCFSWARFSEGLGGNSKEEVVGAVSMMRSTA